MKFEASPKFVAPMLQERDVKFIIPLYQRPYRWGVKECETLWNDIVNAFKEKGEKENEYFLGSIVAFRNGEKTNEFQIIDGQQRTRLLSYFFEHFMNV